MSLTKDQIVDVFTKALKGEQFSKVKIDMRMVTIDLEVGMTSGSLTSEAFITSEPSVSKGVIGENYF